MNQRRLFRLVLAATTWGVLALGPTAAGAASVVLRIRAVNPSATERKPVTINSPLPARVRPQHVIRADELTLTYDVKSGIYHVKGKTELEPKEVRTFEVEIEDIWTIPREGVLGLRKQAEALVALLAGSEHAETANRLHREVGAGLDQVEDRQERTAIGLVQPLEHIHAYERNLALFEHAERDIGILENLAIAAGKNPAMLLGAPQVILKTAPEPALDPEAEGQYRRARVRIEVHNPSPTEPRTVNLKRYLPREITVEDVLETGDLLVGTDNEKNMRFVYKDGVEIAPLQTIAYEVVLRDRWRVTENRIPTLQARATNLLAMAKTEDKHTAVLTLTRNMAEKLDALAAESRPEGLDADYVAFFRDQASALDKIDRQLTRLEDILRISQETEIDFLKEAHDLFKAKAPEKKTTWLLIYIVLGFLGLVSFLFFIRWYGAKGDG